MIEALTTFYAPLAGASSAARRVGWDSPAAHALRHAALCEAAEPLAARQSVLDAGCGEGALLAALSARGFVGAYRGEDALAAMIARADAAGVRGCVVADSWDPNGPRAEVALCSGALNTIVEPDHDALVARALSALWARATCLVAVDLATDRHADGVGIAKADLGRAFVHARTLAPIVVVREDVVPGEALLVMTRSRAPALQRWQPDPLLRADLLVDSEPAAAAALIAALDGAHAEYLRGKIAAGERRWLDAERAFTNAAEHPGARLELAPIYFATGRRAEAEALLRELAAHDDGARAHLAMLLWARRDPSGARGMAATIGDAWIRREVEARVTQSR